VAKFLQLMVIL